MNAKDYLLVLSHTQEMKDWLVVDSFLYLLFFYFVLFILLSLRMLASWLESQLRHSVF